jgi:hypothetical protein
MTEKSLTEMTDDEIIAEIQALRDRRAQARERRNVTTTPKKAVEGKVSDSIWDMLGEEET